MVSPVSLYVFAPAALCVAAVVARLGRTKLHDALADGRAALAGTSLVLGASVVLFAVFQPIGASELWRGAGSVALLASPLGATLGLRFRGRRSIPRALVVSSCALVGVVVWLTLSLRGPRGGWTLIDIALGLPAAAIALASAACLGWWSKRAAIAESTVSEDR